MASSVLLNEAVLPAFERLGLQYLEIPKGPPLVVPLIAQPPASGTLFLTIHANDEAGEALIHVHPCTASAARRPQLALLLAELNTQYRFVTFSMTRDGELRVDVALTFWAVCRKCECRFPYPLFNRGNRIFQRAALHGTEKMLIGGYEESVVGERGGKIKRVVDRAWHTRSDLECAGQKAIRRPDAQWAS